MVVTAIPQPSRSEPCDIERGASARSFHPNRSAPWRRQALGVSGALRIGVNTLPAGGPHLTPAVKECVERHPATRISVTEGVGLLELRRGEVDALACRQPVSEPDIAVGPVLTADGRVLLVAADDPVVARGHATLEDVADHVVLHSELFTDEMMDAWVPRTAPSGRPIARRRHHHRGQVAEVLNLIALGEIVHPTVNSFLTYYRHPDVACVPLCGMPPSETALVWLRTTDSAVLQAYVATIRRLVGPS